MDFDAVASVDESQGVIAGNRMTARWENELRDIVLIDIDGLLAVEVFADGDITLLAVLAVLLVFLLADERHIAAPSLRLVIVFLLFPVNLVDILFTEDDVFQADG